VAIEALFEVREAERAAEQVRAETRDKARKILQDAEREGKELLLKNQEQCKAEAAEALRRAEEAGAGQREEILRAAQDDAKELRARAEERMALAVKAITERVVES